MTLSIDMERPSQNTHASSSPASGKRKSIPSRHLQGLDWFFYNLVFALAFPAFCLAEWLVRRQPSQGSRAHISLFAEARKNEHIALSYAFDVRKTLHQFGRGDQAKRPS
jgi:hypothetical protein